MLRLFCILCALNLAAFGAEKSENAKTPAMREIAPGIYEIGSIHLDKNTNSLSFPCKVQMNEGGVEYLICTPRGSTHESVLVTEIQPSDIHFAMLLLGAKGAGILAPAPGDAPPEQINAEYLKRAPRLKGDSIAITAKWKDADGKEQSGPVEDWVLNFNEKKSASRGPWIYTGSMFAEEKFLAQMEGSIAAIVTNPAALINNPRKGSDNDQIWQVNGKKIPPVETPVEVTLKIETAPESKKK